MKPLVIGGCPGSGKTSVSMALAEAIEDSVVIETDDFFEYLINPVDPSIPAAKAQNETVISAYAEAANVYRKGGYTVILEGVIGPWVFPILIPIVGAFHYFLLHTALKSACERVSQRESKVVSLGKVERMHPQFEKAVATHGTHVIDTEKIPTQAVAEIILKSVEENSCEIQSPG